MVGKMGNLFLVEHETRKTFMNKLEIKPFKCPYSKPTKLLRVVEYFFRICSAFGQNTLNVEEKRYLLS